MRLLSLLALTAAAVWGQAITLDCNLPADVKLDQANPRANLHFLGSTGETIFVRIVGVVTDQGFALNLPKIVDQFGNTSSQIRPQNPAFAGATPLDLGSQFSGSAHGFEIDLFSDSLYTLQLQSANPPAGAELAVVLVRVNRPCITNTALTCGRSAAGAISSGTNNAPPVKPAQVDVYKFDVNSGDVIAFQLLRVASSGIIDGNAQFIFAVYGPDGHVLNMDPATGRLSFDTPPLVVYSRWTLKATSSGTVTILVMELSGGHGGPYYFSATRLNGGCGGQALSCGAVQDSSLNTPMSFGSYTLQANQGDVWQLKVARSDTFGSFTPHLEVYDSLGNRISTVGPASPSGHALSTATLNVTSTGPYTVLVGGTFDGSTGGYTVGTTRLNRPCGEQALGCSTIVDGSVNGLLRSRVYSLQAAAGDTYLVRLLQPNPASLFRPRVDIYDAAGGQVQFLNTADLTRQTFTLPSDGNYTVVVTDSFDNAQSGGFSLSALRLNRPCNPGTLSCGAPSPGSLARTLDTNVFSYTAADQESFSVRLLPTGGVQPVIEVYDAQGNAVGQSANGSFAAVDVVRPAAGGYTIVALDNSKQQGTGAFALDLLRTRNACGQAILQGQPVSGVISASDPFVSYTFSATQSDTLTLRSASSTSGFSAQMELYDPQGARLDSGVFGLSRKVPATGVYTVILGASSARTAGGYALVWQLLNKPVNTTPVACGSTIGGSLAGSSQFRYYTIPADAGDTMRMLLTKTSDNFAPQVELFDPAGARLASNSDVTQKAAAGGNYLVVVSPSTTAFESGSFTLAYQRTNNPCSPAALTCGQTTLRQANLPGQLDALTFPAIGGDLTTIRLATRSGSYSPFVELYNPAGTRLSTSSNGLLRSVLPADGTYTLLVRDRGATNVGSYRVSLQDDTANCPVTDTEAPAITLLKPTGGEVVPGGTAFRIQWLSDDNVGVTSHDIALSTDGGATFDTAVAGALNGNQQVYDWMVPSDVAPSRTAKIRVTATDTAGNSQSATSDLLTLIGSGFTPNASASYTYDALNRLTQVKMDDGRTVQYTWDAAGNLVQITVTGQ